jgi:hypothetical protein
MTDTSELENLALNLGKAGREVTLAATKVIERSALAVKQGMQQDFTNIGAAPHGTVPHIADAIDYDVRGLSYEVGINKARRQGPLGSILAFGTSTQPALVDHEAAMRRELPRLEFTLGEVGVMVLE